MPWEARGVHCREPAWIGGVWHTLCSPSRWGDPLPWLRGGKKDEVGRGKEGMRRGDGLTFSARGRPRKCQFDIPTDLQFLEMAMNQ